MEKKCLQCKSKNHCCKNGFAFVGIEDAKKIKEFLDYSKLSKPIVKHLRTSDQVLESSLRFTLLNDDKILRLKKNGRNCIFLKNGECSIYEVRPKICNMYPYWCIRLLDGTVKVIDHDDTYCLVRNSTVLTTDQEAIKRKIFSDILDEGVYYKKHIVYFFKEHNL